VHRVSEIKNIRKFSLVKQKEPSLKINYYLFLKAPFTIEAKQSENQNIALVTTDMLFKQT